MQGVIAFGLALAGCQFSAAGRGGTTTASSGGIGGGTEVATAGPPSSGGGDVATPNLVGMTLEQAQSAARAAGIRPELDDANFPCDGAPRPPGQIDCQSPSAGEPTQPYTVIQVHVSRATTRPSVADDSSAERRSPPPDRGLSGASGGGDGSFDTHAVFGLSRADAEAKLHASGFANVMVIGAATSQAATPAGANDYDPAVAKVCWIAPDGTIRAKDYAQRTVMLALCPLRDTHRSIDLVGFDLDTAQLAIRQLGFTGKLAVKPLDHREGNCADSTICRVEPSDWARSRPPILTVYIHEQNGDDQ
jgi:hypothetical protein